MRAKNAETCVLRQKLKINKKYQKTKENLLIRYVLGNLFIQKLSLSYLGENRLNRLIKMCREIAKKLKYK